MLCPKCKQQVPEKADNCPACGARVEAVPATVAAAPLAANDAAAREARLAVLHKELETLREKQKWPVVKVKAQELLDYHSGDNEALDAIEEACFAIEERTARRWWIGLLIVLVVGVAAGTGVYLLVMRPNSRYQEGTFRLRSAADATALKEAQDLLHGAASLGHVRAMWKLGQAYERLGKLEDNARNEQQAVAWWQRAAAKGDVDAMAEMGDAYASGRGGLPKDARLSLEWYGKAAERGNAVAMLALGRQHAAGTQPADAAAAAEWYRKAAEAGNADAMYLLSQSLAAGTGVQPNAAESIEWLKKAADGKNIEALCKLGRAYLKGEGVVKDVDAGLACYREAASRGNLRAMLILAEEYNHLGNGALSTHWYEKAAGVGSDDAAYELGLNCFTGKTVKQDYQQAEKWFLLAASSGNSLAMVYLGDICATTYRGDDAPAAALEWYRKAAAAGNLQGMIRVGGCYVRGLGVDKDPAQALAWYRKAADAGAAEAMRLVGAALLSGDGAAKDPVAAGVWLRKAADKNDAAAFNLLGDMYRDGVGVERNPDIAGKLYQAARDNGYRD